MARKTPYGGSSHGGGGGGLTTLLGIVANLFGGKSPEYIEETPAITDVSGLEPGSVQVAAKPGYYKSNYNAWDRISGQPDLASEYNFKIKASELAGQQNLQNNIAQAKALQPLYTDEALRLNREQGRLTNINREASALKAGEENVLNRSLYDPSVNTTGGSPFIPGTTTVDPAIAFKARSNTFAPAYTGESANVSGNNLVKAKNQAEILGIGDVVGSEQEAARSGNLLKTALNNRGMVFNAATLPSDIQTAEVQAKNTLIGQKASTPFMSLKPAQEFEHQKSITDLNKATKSLYESGRAPLYDAQRLKAVQDAEKTRLGNRPFPEKMAEFDSPNIATPQNSVTKDRTSTAPVSQSDWVEGVHFTNNPDGTIKILVPTLSPSGKIIQPGTYK